MGSSTPECAKPSIIHHQGRPLKPHFCKSTQSWYRIGQPLDIFNTVMYEKELLTELESAKAVPLLSKGQSAFCPNPSVNGLRDKTTSPTNDNSVSEDKEVDKEESDI